MAADQKCARYLEISKCPESIRSWLRDNISGDKEKLANLCILNDVAFGRRSINTGTGGHLMKGHFQVFSTEKYDGGIVYWNDGEAIFMTNFLLHDTIEDIDEFQYYGF